MYYIGITARVQFLTFIFGMFLLHIGDLGFWNFNGNPGRFVRGCIMLRFSRDAGLCWMLVFR